MSKNPKETRRGKNVVRSSACYLDRKSRWSGDSANVDEGVEEAEDARDDQVASSLAEGRPCSKACSDGTTAKKKKKSIKRRPASLPKKRDRKQSSRASQPLPIHARLRTEETLEANGYRTNAPINPKRELL
ncbi:hypothetical protein MRX96_028560 [Rhipicephalus microplus]